LVARGAKREGGKKREGSGGGERGEGEDEKVKKKGHQFDENKGDE